MFKNFLSILMLIVLLSSLSISCVSLSSHLQYANRSPSEIPVDAFAFVSVTHRVIPDKCLPSDEFDKCEEIISKLPPIVARGSGSGLLMWANGRPIFLTAAHVCTHDFPEIFEQQGIKFSVRLESIIKIRNTSGKFLETEVITLDEKKDLCALSVPSMVAPPVKVSHKPPKIGDPIYAISAPYGINSPTMTLIFSGYYSGHDKRWHFFTIPTRPGSSGSVVLNENFQAVGMLNAAYLDIESVGLGAGHKDIVNFLKGIN